MAMSALLLLVVVVLFLIGGSTVAVAAVFKRQGGGGPGIGVAIGCAGIGVLLFLMVAGMLMFGVSARRNVAVQEAVAQEQQAIMQVQEAVLSKNSVVAPQAEQLFSSAPVRLKLSFDRVLMLSIHNQTSGPMSPTDLSDDSTWLLENVTTGVRTGIQKWDDDARLIQPQTSETFRVEIPMEKLAGSGALTVRVILKKAGEDALVAVSNAVDVSTAAKPESPPNPDQPE